MINVIDVNNQQIDSDKYAFAIKFGKKCLYNEQLASACFFQDTLFVYKRRSETVGRVLVFQTTTTVSGFISTPRLFKENDGYSFDNENSVLLSEGNGTNTYPLDDSSNTSQTLILGNYDIPEIARDVQLYGNIDWLVPNSEESKTLTWKGPAGRLLSFDRKSTYLGYSAYDESVGEHDYYTCFQPNIYAGGNIVETLPVWGGAGEVPVKILGAAYHNDFIIVILNINFRDMPNPDNTTGGFFEFVFINDKPLSLPKNPIEVQGWRQLWYRRAGGATDIWRFNSDGLIAVNSNNEQLRIIPKDVGQFREYDVELTTLESGFGTGVETRSPDGSREQWNLNLSATKYAFRDFLLTQEKYCTFNYTNKSSSSRFVASNTTNAMVAIKLPGVLTMPTFSISIGTGNTDPWGLGLGVDATPIVSGTTCAGCDTNDSWSRAGYDTSANCGVAGTNRSVSVTRTTTCAGLGVSSANATKSFGKNLTVIGMGWKLISTNNRQAEQNCSVLSIGTTINNPYYPSTSKYLYVETVYGMNSLAGCQPGTGGYGPPCISCTFAGATPLNTYSGSWTYYRQAYQSTFDWQCLNGTQDDWIALGYQGVYGPKTPNAVTMGSI